MVFDLSSESSKKRPIKPTAKTPPTPKVAPPSMEDTQEMLQNMAEKHSELMKKMDVAFEKAGVDPKELKDYCQDPSHFSPSQWKKFKAESEEIELKLSGLSKEGLMKKHKKSLDSKAGKDRKGKMLGARKQWLNMH